MLWQNPIQSLLALAITFQPYIQISESLSIPKTKKSEIMNISQRVASHPTYTSLQAYLSSSQSKAYTLSTFTSSIFPWSTEEQIASHLQGSWDSLILIASETPFDSEGQDKLADLLVELQSQPSSEDAIYKDKVFSWKELPDFGTYARSSWNFAPSETSNKQQNDKWANQNAFIARLTARTLSNPDTGAGSPADFSLYGIWSLRELENETMEQVLDANVKAAAIWIVYAGQTMWKLSQEGREYEGRMGRGGDRFKEKGWKGYTVERWEVWAQEFKTFSELSGKSAETVEVVNKAIAVMESSSK